MQTVGVKVEWLLPADVLIPEGIAPIVGWWDERKKEGGDNESGGEWNDEGINEITLVDACLVYALVLVPCIIYCTKCAESELQEERDEGRVLSFLTMHLTALAILQRRWQEFKKSHTCCTIFILKMAGKLTNQSVSRACFPFQSWMLQPMAPNKAMLTLQLRGGFNIKFEIGAGGCRLLHPAEESLRQDKSLYTSVLSLSLFRCNVWWH